MKIAAEVYYVKAMGIKAIHDAFVPPLALHNDHVMHMISCTKPCHSSVCNIEKLGIGLGTRLSQQDKSQVNN